MSNYCFPENCKAIIDVTKPPYCIDNTGKIDCTKQLCQIIDDVIGNYVHNFYETKEKLESMEDPNALITFEIRKINGRSNVIFPEHIPPSKIIYFPNGVYLVSDTISYSYEELRNILKGIRHMEMNAQIRIVGQSRDGVTIRLKDNCKGFEYGNDRPIISFMQGEASNIAMTNMLENITIDVGSGNPGATGIRYFANNTGAIRNVRILSSDPQYRGHTGLSILHERISSGYVKNLEVIGFQYGIKVDCQRIYTTFEHIYLCHQKRAGILVKNISIAIRDLKSENSVPAINVDGYTTKLLLTDATLTGGNPLDTAIRASMGQCMLRNIFADGYEHTAITYEATLDGYIDEVCTFGPVTLFGEEEAKSLNLPVEDTPEIEWENPSNWVCVNDFGAIGDGVTDDTVAIQKAFNSGHSTIYFQPGKYLLNDVITIPATVNRVNFMYCDLLTSEKLAAMKHTGAFLIEQNSSHPLIIEDLYAMEKFYGFVSLIQHSCQRTLIVSDVHVQAASLYFNTVSGGKVFMENAGCTIGGIPGAGNRSNKLPGEDKYPYSREVPCFSFTGQTVWCRQLNPERSLHEVINDGGSLWVFGCKTEEEGTGFETLNHGYTEVLGAVFCLGWNKQYPAIINNNSNVSVFASTYDMGCNQYWPIAVQEIQGNSSLFLYGDDLPISHMDSYVIPLYIGLTNLNVD